MYIYERRMIMDTVIITTEYITLGQLIKYLNMASSGGEVKHFLATHEIYVNDVLENRRGKKLYDGDRVSITKMKRYLIKHEASQS